MKHKRNAMYVVNRVMAMIILLQITPSKAVESVDESISLQGCPDSCGGTPIPYPFGVGANCSLSEDFDVSCNMTSNGTVILYLKVMDYYEISILNITIPLGQIRLNLPVTYHCYIIEEKYENIGPYWEIESLYNSFWVNSEKNKFTVTGCNSVAFLRLDFKTDFKIGCVSTCDSADSLNKYKASCFGIGCCQTDIPKGTNYFYIDWDENYNNSKVYNFSRCSYAMVTDDVGTFNTSYITTDDLTPQRMPAVFDWTVGNTTCKHAQTNRSSYACKSDHSVCSDYLNGQGYTCHCSDGYQGNPYLQGLGGCQDINECVAQNPCSKPSKCHNLAGGYRCSCPFGLRSTSNNTQNPCEINLALVIGGCIGIVSISFVGFVTYVFRERRNLSKVKEKYFQEHGGWILLEKIKSNQRFGFAIFTKQQVEQATNNFNNANIIGRGGNGIVYKGILRDQMVAIKKCKIVDESKKIEFGKEMLILSQISHKNIVKLLGCCLEVEVPMLVYEFIPNGTLSQHIHHKNPGPGIPLTTRLRIAYESAEALAYLHTSASPPIIHGDVKPTNILLDQNYTAKVSDFGASMLAPANGESQVVTYVQGTFGYLDPEYMQSHRLTNKSDVYSFGVVILELLTRKPLIDCDKPEEERGLASWFLSAMRENRMEELLDNEIKHDDNLELIREVADLAKECLSMKGEERPTMKEVAEELHRISKLKQHPWEREYYNPEESMMLLSEESCHDQQIEMTGYSYNADKEAEESIAAGR